MIASGTPRMPEMESFLRARLDVLIDPRRPEDNTAEDAKESVAIAIGLGQAYCAAQIWRDHPSIDVKSLELGQYDTLAFSKLLHYLGDDQQAAELLGNVPEPHSLATEQQIAALQFIFNKRDPVVLERWAYEIASTHRLAKEDVKKSIRAWIKAIGDEKTGLLMTRSVDFCKNPNTSREN